MTDLGQQLGLKQVKAMSDRIAQLNTKEINDLRRFDVLDSRQLHASLRLTART